MEEMNSQAGRTQAVLRSTLRRHRGALAVFLVMSAVNLALFSLYRLELGPFLYGEVLCAASGAVMFLISLGREMKRAEERQRLLAFPCEEWSLLPEPESLEAADYRQMVRSLGHRAGELAAGFEEDRQDMLDYYTAWVHQIKTPIAVMKLYLGAEDSQAAEALRNELFRIEQYVDMVLHYIRLGSESNDLVVQEYDLDELVRESVRKFAPQFIGRHLRVEFEPTGRRIVTDRKWFAVILEQILSNAVKYTPEGGITIRLEEDRLCISDTGIGIAAQDLPRIFEKGYTGGNGRLGMKSSGLGLYLCRQAADRLHIPISADSEVGRGTTFRLDLRQSEQLL